MALLMQRSFVKSNSTNTHNLFPNHCFNLFSTPESETPKSMHFNGITIGETSEFTTPY